MSILPLLLALVLVLPVAADISNQASSDSIANSFFNETQSWISTNENVANTDSCPTDWNL
jgi:hypothetical protein